MSWVLEVEAKGLSRPTSRLRGFGRRAVDARPVFRRLAALLLRENKQRWRRNGYGWAGLADSTLERKTREKKDPRLLRVHGVLESALTEWGAAGQRLDVRRDELIVGLQHSGPAYYGRFHHHGKGVPSRPLVKATPTMRRKVADVIREYLIGGPDG